jgi:tetratricopeptide (TPR) repeat protein
LPTPRRRSPFAFVATFGALAGGALLTTPVVVRAETLGADLVAAARSGGRPEECGGAIHSRAGRWERARYPGLGPYCDALAKGHALLRTAPDQALNEAATAENALPGRSGPLVLAGRAQVALGAYEDARERFARARAISKRSVEPPAVLHDLAVAELYTGHAAEALAAFRELVPRAELLGDERAELVVLVEACVVAMSQGEATLPEAIGYASEARRRTPLPGLGDAVQAALALALDRSGRVAEAAGVAAESSGPWALEAERDRRAKSPLTAVGVVPMLPKPELDAMIAILAEKRDRDLALERWGSYLAAPEGAKGPFAAHATAHRAALLRGHGPAPRPRAPKPKQAPP